MATYTIIRVYEVPADNRIEATNRMLEALALGVESDFHVKDIIREPEGKPGSGVEALPAARLPAGQGRQVSLKPPKGWGTMFLDQLLGRAEYRGKR